MIVLDTNVLSEPIRTVPDPGVLAWLADQHDTAITAITAGELLLGVAMLPEGRRRTGLARTVEAALAGFAGRVLRYDFAAAREYAAIREECRRQGRGIGVEDAMIAATVRSAGASLATRNTRDFAGLGFDLVDPWAR